MFGLSDVGFTLLNWNNMSAGCFDIHPGFQYYHNRLCLTLRRECCETKFIYFDFLCCFCMDHDSCCCCGGAIQSFPPLNISVGTETCCAAVIEDGLVLAAAKETMVYIPELFSAARNELPTPIE